jgi:hypothetical protein
MAPAHRPVMSMGFNGSERRQGHHGFLQSFPVLPPGERSHRTLLDGCMDRGSEHCRHCARFGHYSSKSPADALDLDLGARLGRLDLGYNMGVHGGGDDAISRRSW